MAQLTAATYEVGTYARGASTYGGMSHTGGDMSPFAHELAALERAGHNIAWPSPDGEPLAIARYVTEKRTLAVIRTRSADMHQGRRGKAQSLIIKSDWLSVAGLTNLATDFANDTLYLPSSGQLHHPSELHLPPELAITIDTAEAMAELSMLSDVIETIRWCVTTFGQGQAIWLRLRNFPNPVVTWLLWQIEQLATDPRAPNRPIKLSFDTQPYLPQSITATPAYDNPGLIVYRTHSPNTTYELACGQAGNPEPLIHQRIQPTHQQSTPRELSYALQDLWRSGLSSVLRTGPAWIFKPPTSKVSRTQRPTPLNSPRPSTHPHHESPELPSHQPAKDTRQQPLGPAERPLLTDVDKKNKVDLKALLNKAIPLYSIGVVALVIAALLWFLFSGVLTRRQQNNEPSTTESMPHSQPHYSKVHYPENGPTGLTITTPDASIQQSQVPQIDSRDARTKQEA